MTAVAPRSLARRRCLLPLLLAYPLLVVAGMVSGRQVFALLAVAVLVTAALLPQLLGGRASAWMWWLLAQALVLGLAWLGWADLLLEAVPVLINALLGWWFGRTLFTARPLVARCIVAIEGAARLRERGVARYARQLTAVWTAVLAAQAGVLLWLWLCAAQVGVLARLGVAPTWRVSGPWVAAWLHVGGYLLLAVVFVLEYGYRRWHLRHLQHMGLPQMLLRLAANWPQLLRDRDAAR